MDEKSLIVIATSAPSNRPRYRRDLLNCLCYPQGHLVRFSYRRQWISDDVLSAQPGKGGAPAIIVFCDVPSRPEQDFSFLPLRLVQLEGFEPSEIVERDLATSDTHIALRFRLGRFVFLAPSTAETQIEEWKSWIHDQGEVYPRPIGHPEQGKGRYVFEASNLPEREHVQEATSWITLTEHLSEARTLNDCSFFQVTGIDKLGSKGERQTVVTKQFLERPAYRLDSGKTYRMGLRYHMGHGPDLTKTLIPQASSKTISLTQPMTDSVGLQTEASIVIGCNQVYSHEVLTLVVEDPDDTIARAARAEFILTVHPPAWILPVVIAVLAIGALFTGVSGDTIKELTPDGSMIEGHASTISYAAKGLGTFLVGLGGYLGFRRLPST